MRSAMHAASQLPGRRPTDVDCTLIKNAMMMIMLKPISQTCRFHSVNSKAADLTAYTHMLIWIFITDMHFKPFMLINLCLPYLP